jgi:hypothetical protein
MQRARIRLYVLLIVVALAVASMFPSLGGNSPNHPAPRAHKSQAVAAKTHTDLRASFGLTK